MCLQRTHDVVHTLGHIVPRKPDQARDAIAISAADVDEITTDVQYTVEIERQRPHPGGDAGRYQLPRIGHYIEARDVVSRDIERRVEERTTGID